MVGAANLNALGNLYTQNQSAFSGTHIVNIDNQTTNTSFGQTNVVDTNASAVCEVMTNVISDLGFVLDTDSASNLLTGIFDATNNLLDPKVTADTYMAVANCLRVGGRKPVSGPQVPVSPQQDLSSLIPKQEPIVQPVSVQQPSPEERPLQEGVISETPEPDWLTPKIFKGTSLG